MQVLDPLTVQRIRDCKRHGFPICLEEAFLRIFHEERGQALLNRYVKKLSLRFQNVESAEEIWGIYDQVLVEVAKDLGKDVSQVIGFQSLREMEMMKGCVSCPLYQREAGRIE
ncbi:MAG TPA: hypothetical protein VED17_09150 [Nitrososphaerales archaeon]|nr:hypothetical protein [Nitrososphaerales archaeon]